MNWTDDAVTIYLNAIDWAIQPSQGEVHGAVTSDDETIAGATVRAEVARVWANNA
jgi:hypothetical protein